MPFGGVGSSGSASVLIGPPVRAYGQPANDCATTSLPSAAARMCSVPSVRSRLVRWNALSMFFMSMPVSAVIWWTITSGWVASIAALTEAASRPSMICAFAPSARSAPALASVRVVPVTVWPLAIRSGMSARPAAPVAPAMRMCMVPVTRRREML